MLFKSGSEIIAVEKPNRAFSYRLHLNNSLIILYEYFPLYSTHASTMLQMFNTMVISTVLIAVEKPNRAFSYRLHLNFSIIILYESSPWMSYTIDHG
jgi:hypothetical protein